MRDRTASFGRALHAVRAALGLSQDALGGRLGVSRRTLTRWEVYDQLPPVGQRKHLATSFPDVAPELVAALVASLKLGDGFVVSRSAPRPDAAQSAAVVDGAFLELCEHADVAPGRLRAPLVAFLRRVEASGLSVGEARALLEPKTKARPGGGN